jgi:hypothetical protein
MNKPLRFREVVGANLPKILEVVRRGRARVRADSILKPNSPTYRLRVAAGCRRALAGTSPGQATT